MLENNVKKGPLFITSHLGGLIYFCLLKKVLRKIPPRQVSAISLGIVKCDVAYIRNSVNSRAVFCCCVK